MSAQDRATEHRLRTIAEQSADGPIKSAQAVESTRSDAVRVTSGDIVRGREKVWAIQVEGVHDFVCRDCTGPPGAPAPHGRFLTIIVDATTFQTTDGGMGPTRADLSKLGAVIDLDR